ncbi:MAG TPA: hypothetical protein VME22_07665 [Solirubrobacteraceae bacterium]|nr:hypothetical protein [Solirubrobacteraceae bacterium]
MSKKADKGADKAEGKKDKKAKKGKGSAGAAAGPSVAAHPRASYQVRRAKGWGGIAGFALAAYFSYKAGVPYPDLGLRALIAGIVGYMLAWACSVTIWRHLVLAELRAALERSGGPDPDLIPARAPQAAQNPSPEQVAAGS